MTLLEAPQPSAPARRSLRLPLPVSVLDPLLLGLVALVVYALHGFEGPLGRDLGVFVYGGEHVARGVPPYVGVFNTVGPLADAVPGLAIWLGHEVGVGPILSARLFFLVLSAVVVALVSVLARDTFGSRSAGLVAPAVFLTFECFVRLASSGPREKTTMLVFLVLSLILVGRRRWFLAGVCAALATLTWQPALVMPVAAVLVAALTAGSGRSRVLLRFVTGGLVPTLATVLFYLQAGSLRMAVDGFWVVNLRYTTQPTIFNRTILVTLWEGYHGSLVLVVVGLLALFVLAVRAAPYAVLPVDGPPTVPWRVTALGAAALAGTVWTLCVINGGPDLFLLLPVTAVGVAGLVVMAAARLARGVTRSAPLLVALVVVAAVVTAGIESVTTRDDRLVQQRADVRAVLATQPSSARIVSIDAPQVLAIAGRDNPWPYQLFDERMTRFLDATQPDGTDGFADRLARVSPTFVVVGSTSQTTWAEPTLADRYQLVGHGPGWDWFVNDDAGPQALADARAANDAAMGH